jgi:hypothetical protein
LADLIGASEWYDGGMKDIFLFRLKKKAKSVFVPGFSILPNEQYNFENFPSLPS